MPKGVEPVVPTWGSRDAAARHSLDESNALFATEAVGCGCTEEPLARLFLAAPVRESTRGDGQGVGITWEFSARGSTCVARVGEGWNRMLPPAQGG